MEERFCAHHQIDTRSSASHAPPTGAALNAVNAVAPLFTTNDPLRRGITSPARAPQDRGPQIRCWKNALVPAATQGKVVVRSSLTFKKARVTPAEYPAWRTFCEAVDRAFGQTMLVSK